MILDLESVRVVLEALGRAAQIVRLRLGLLGELAQVVHDLTADLRQVVVLVALGVLRHGALFADGHVARLAEEAQQLGAVHPAVQGLFHLDVFLGVLQLVHREHAVAVETEHELVRHDAVRAQEVGAVETARDGALLFALATRARDAGTVERRRLEDVGDGEVWVERRDAVRAQVRLLAALRARDAVRLVRVLRHKNVNIRARLHTCHTFFFKFTLHRTITPRHHCNTAHSWFFVHVAQISLLLYLNCQLAQRPQVLRNFFQRPFPVTKVRPKTREETTPFTHLFKTRLAECVKTWQHFWNGISVVAEAALGVD